MDFVSNLAAAIGRIGKINEKGHRENKKRLIIIVSRGIHHLKADIHFGKVGRYEEDERG